MIGIVGLALALGALLLYAASNPLHDNLYTHFVWQADAFLHGRVSFPYPVEAGPDNPANWYFQDVYPLLDASGIPTGQVLIPFPPLPAIVLLPFVAVFGLFTDQDAVAIGLGAIGVAAAWWMLGGLRISLGTRVLVTILFATGTVWWWAAAVGSTWYLAHLVAVLPAMLAVGVALRHDRRAEREDGLPDDQASDGEAVVAMGAGTPTGFTRARPTGFAPARPTTAVACGGRSCPSTAPRCLPACCSASRPPPGSRSCSRRHS